MDIEKDGKDAAAVEAPAPAKEENQLHTLLLCKPRTIQRSETPSPSLIRSSPINKQGLLPRSPKM